MRIIELTMSHMEWHSMLADSEKVLLAVTDPYLSDEDVQHNIQRAFTDWVEKNGFVSVDDANEKGVFFGKNFKEIMIPENTAKYGFVVIHPVEFYADYDKGFRQKAGC